MARLVIDPIARTIRLRDRVWRFEWEPAAATAAVELGSRRFELQDLTWRSKRNLARAARKVGGGEDALGTLLLAACLPPRMPLPADADEREALTHFAAWFVGDGAIVPWDPAVLARVTLDVCRSAQLTPQMLDDLPAADVEAMWSVARQNAPPAPTHRAAQATPDGFNRIVIVPDPVPAERSADAPAFAAQIDRPDQVVEAADVELPAARSAPGRDPAPEADAPRTTARVSHVADAATPAPGARRTQVARPVSPARFRVHSLGTSAVPPSARRTGAGSAAAPVRDDSEAVRAAVGASSADPGSNSGLSRSRLSQPSPVATRLGHSSLGTTPIGLPRTEPVAAPASETNALPGSGHAPALAVPEAVASPLSSTWSYDPFIGDDDPFADEDRARKQADADRLGFAEDLERSAVEAGVDLES